MNNGLTRRRVMKIAGAAAAAPLLAGAAGGLVGTKTPPIVRWRGVAMGAPASLTLCHPDPSVSRAAIEACTAEVMRLEAVFSLHRADSELVGLNIHGALPNPSHDLVKVMAAARTYGAATDGAFDPTVQPLWSLYASYFSAKRTTGPARRRIEAARALVDYRAIEIDHRRIVFVRPGMAVALNGIAQGYITDRVTDLLRNAGFDNVLVEMGESRALGGHPSGRTWRIGIADPATQVGASGTPLHTLALDNNALATSGGYGTRFEPTGRFNHLFDPATGASANRLASVSVRAPSAMQADALATALAVMAPEKGRVLVSKTQGLTALFVHPGGRVEAL